MKYIQRVPEEITGAIVFSTPGTVFFPKETISKTYSIIDGGGPGIVDGVIDLSYRTPDMVMSRYRNTANCYIIYASGVFMLPCVYGNAIKGGLTNAPAYTNNGGTYSTNFVNHLGNTITDPWIESNSGCTISSCEVVWQDSPNMIQDLQVITSTDSKKYLRFNINNIPNDNGNAIIAVKDSNGDIMWSWHIWCVNYERKIERVEMENHTGVKYNFMKYPLGWKWDDTGFVHGRCCHYQWGRKDPMPCPAAYNSSSNTAISGSKTWGTAAAATIADAIKTPHLFRLYDGTTYYNWFTGGSKYNLWDANVTLDGVNDNLGTVIKTVYDPCPYGYTLPVGRSFTGFTTTGGNTSTASQFNVIGSFANGWNFKKNNSDAVGEFFSASGYRSYTSGGLGNVGSNGIYWDSASNSQAYAYFLNFYSGLVYPLYSYSRAYGFAVRPVLELN